MATSLLSGWPALVRISVETVDALDRIKSQVKVRCGDRNGAGGRATIQPFRLAYGPRSLDALHACECLDECRLRSYISVALGRSREVKARQSARDRAIGGMISYLYFRIPVGSSPDSS